MRSNLEGPANIGSPEYVTVREEIGTVIAISGKQPRVQHVPGPVAFSNALQNGMQVTYAWIEQQLRKGTSIVEHGERSARAVP